MKRFLTRMRGAPAPEPEHEYQVAALRMQLLVAMAASDGGVQPVEIDAVARVIDDSSFDEATSERLEQLLRILLEAPPHIEQVVGRIVEQAPNARVAEQLVQELVQLASVDDRLDEREEALLRLLCGAMQLEPSSLHRGRRAPLDARERAELDALLESVRPA